MMVYNDTRILTHILLDMTCSINFSSIFDSIKFRQPNRNKAIESQLKHLKDAKCEISHLLTIVWSPLNGRAAEQRCDERRRDADR